MSASSFTVTREGEVAVLMLQRAFSLDSAGKAELTSIISDLKTIQPPRVMILTDIHSQALLVNVVELADMSAAEARAFSSAGHRLAQVLDDVPFPTIAAVEGRALGGGCELALACDLTIAGEGAKFGQIEALGGVMPGFGGTWRLARRVGFQRACEMMYTGSVIDAITAKAYGLVLEVTRAGEAMAAAKELAERIGKTSQSSIAAIKRVAHAAWNVEPSQADALEEAAFPKLFGSEQSARMHAFLKEQASTVG